MRLTAIFARWPDRNIFNKAIWRNLHSSPQEKSSLSPEGFICLLA
jgi:hypothetical protein